jgi:hypothetical protein
MSIKIFFTAFFLSTYVFTETESASFGSSRYVSERQPSPLRFKNPEFEHGISRNIDSLDDLMHRNSVNNNIGSQKEVVKAFMLMMTDALLKKSDPSSEDYRLLNEIYTVLKDPIDHNSKLENEQKKPFKWG